ncbi:MAG: undecaprenyl diphosphate synthase [Limisphaerales bacterium]|jgi:undecaprenyl diphosphate synthase
MSGQLAQETLIPSHVGIIMDGNHRWAKNKRLPGAAGHRAGARRLREIAEASADLGVKHLTLFAFSTENWQRPSTEVSLLMDLMRHVMQNDIKALDKRNVRLRVIGSREKFAPDIQAQMAQCEALTENNKELNLSVAVNFGGRWDIVQAAKKTAEKVAAGELKTEDIDEATFAENMSLSGIPDPDLLIRTGGEHRVSNFLLWDLAYTELYFTETYWPDFDGQSLQTAIEEYSNRARRFGRRE